MLRGEPRLGRDVRRDLARHGARRSGPAFYQMMARLEDAALVVGEYDQKVVAGQIIKERRYTLTPAGRVEGDQGLPAADSAAPSQSWVPTTVTIGVYRFVPRPPATSRR